MDDIPDNRVDSFKLARKFCLLFAAIVITFMLAQMILLSGGHCSDIE
jgi:hypothetical protein